MFKHCDAAGIVFFPRYFEMISDCMETFFQDVADYPFNRMHENAGVPTVQLDTSFSAPSLLGEMLTLSLECRHLGRTSLKFRITARCADQVRFTADQVIVHTSSDLRPQAWPEPVRAKLTQQLEDA